MDIATQKVGNLLILEPQVFEINNSSCSEFKTTLFNACENNHDILLDLSQIKSLDSGGLGAIMNLGLSIKAQNGRKFALCNLSKPVSSIFSLTHLDQLFKVYEGLQTAIDDLTSEVKKKGAVLFLGDAPLLRQLQSLSDELMFETKENPEASYKYILCEEKQVKELQNKNGTLLILTENGGETKYPGERVLELPLSDEEMRTLVRALEEGIQENKTLNKLSEKYRATLPEKLAHLQHLIDTQSYRELKEATHKLAGSAGTYGYLKAGHVCKEMELLLDGGATPSISELQELLKKIKFHFNTHFGTGTSLKAKSFLKSTKTAILCLSKDEIFLSAIKQASQNFEIDLDETDLDKAYDIVILDDIDRIREFKDTYSRRRDQVKLWLALEGNNIEDRIRATNAGADLFITKPINSKILETIFKQKLHQSSYKVLVVDDDPDITHFIQEALKEWGIQVQTLSEGSKILETLHEFKPQLLLLDILLPTYDGWALLKALRSDQRYKNLKIIIITALNKNEMTKKGDYDDIWYKPLDKAALQRKVYELAKGEASEDKLSEISFTHFLPQITFKNLLQTILNTEKKLSEVENEFVIVGSLDFEKLSSAEQTDFLIFSENLLHRLLPSDALYGYLGKGRFALFYTSLFPTVLDESLHKFLNESEYQYILPRTASGEQLYSTFSVLHVHCGVVPQSATDLISFGTKAYDTFITFPSQLFTLDYK